MDISKLEKELLSSNVYDDLRGVDSLPRSKGPARSTSTIGYISPRQIDVSRVKRPTVSLILPSPTLSSSIEQMTTSDTILSIDNTKRSTSVESNEQKNKDLLTNKNKNQSLETKANDQSCIRSTMREVMRLICIALFTGLIATVVFTLVFFAFDTYWLEQPILNGSSWWWLDNNNNTNLTDFDYDTNSITRTINYDDEY